MHTCIVFRHNKTAQPSLIITRYKSKDGAGCWVRIPVVMPAGLRHISLSYAAGRLVSASHGHALTPSRRLKVAALSGASAVALGAYGAHTLRPTGPDADYYVTTFDRASRYHLTHSLLIAAAPLARCASHQLTNGLSPVEPVQQTIC